MTLVKLFQLEYLQSKCVFFVCLSPGSVIPSFQQEKSIIITVYSFFLLFTRYNMVFLFDTPSQKYAILSLSWLYAVTGIICTATFLFLKFEFTM